MDYEFRRNDDTSFKASIHLAAEPVQGASSSITKNSYDLALKYSGDMVRIFGKGIRITAYGDIKVKTERKLYVKIGLVQSATSCKLAAWYGRTQKRGDLSVEHRVACPMKDSLNNAGIWYSDDSVVRQWIVEGNTVRHLPFHVEIADAVGDSFPLNYPRDFGNTKWPMRKILIRKEFVSCVMLAQAYETDQKVGYYCLDCVRWRAEYEGAVQEGTFVPSLEGHDFYRVEAVEAGELNKMPDGLKLDGPNVSHGETTVLSAM